MPKRKRRSGRSKKKTANLVTDIENISSRLVSSVINDATTSKDSATSPSNIEELEEDLISKPETCLFQKKMNSSSLLPAFGFLESQKNADSSTEVKIEVADPTGIKLKLPKNIAMEIDSSPEKKESDDDCEIVEVVPPSKKIEQIIIEDDDVSETECKSKPELKTIDDYVSKAVLEPGEDHMELTPEELALELVLKAEACEDSTSPEGSQTSEPEVNTAVYSTGMSGSQPDKRVPNTNQVEEHVFPISSILQECSNLFPNSAELENCYDICALLSSQFESLNSKEYNIHDIDKNIPSGNRKIVESNPPSDEIIIKPSEKESSLQSKERIYGIDKSIPSVIQKTVESNQPTNEVTIEPIENGCNAQSREIVDESSITISSITSLSDVNEFFVTRMTPPLESSLSPEENQIQLLSKTLSFNKLTENSIISSNRKSYSRFDDKSNQPKRSLHDSKDSTSPGRIDHSLINVKENSNYSDDFPSETFQNVPSSVVQHIPSKERSPIYTDNQDKNIGFSEKLKTLVEYFNVNSPVLNDPRLNSKRTIKEPSLNTQSIETNLPNLKAPDSDLSSDKTGLISNQSAQKLFRIPKTENCSNKIKTHNLSVLSRDNRPFNANSEKSNNPIDFPFYSSKKNKRRIDSESLLNRNEKIFKRNRLTFYQQPSRNILLNEKNDSYTNSIKSIPEVLHKEHFLIGQLQNSNKTLLQNQSFPASEFPDKITKEKQNYFSEYRSNVENSEKCSDNTVNGLLPTPDYANFYNNIPNYNPYSAPYIRYCQPYSFWNCNQYQPFCIGYNTSGMPYVWPNNSLPMNNEMAYAHNLCMQNYPVIHRSLGNPPSTAVESPRKSTSHIGSNNSLSKQPEAMLIKSASLISDSLKADVGHNIITSSDIYLIIIEWCINWFVEYEAMAGSLKHLPPILPTGVQLSKVQNAYKDEKEYYTTYFKLLLMECWYKLYLSSNVLRHPTRSHVGKICEHELKNESNKYVVEYFAHMDDEELLPKENCVVLVQFSSPKCMLVGMLGYVACVMSRSYEREYDIDNEAYKALDAPSGHNIRKYKITLFTVFKTDDIDIEGMVYIRKIFNIRKFLQQNDALCRMSNSRLSQIVLNPIASPYKLCVLNEEAVKPSLDYVFTRILDANPLLGLINYSKTCTERMDIVVYLIHRLLKSKVDSKIIICSKSDNTLSKIAIDLHRRGIELVFASKDRAADLQIYTLEKSAEKISENANHKNLSNHEKKKIEAYLLKQCRVLLVPLLGYHDVLHSLLESVTIACCILDEAHLCTEPESIIPLTFGIKKYILIGNKNFLCDVSPITAKFEYNQSLFIRASL